MAREARRLDYDVAVLGGGAAGLAAAGFAGVLGARTALIEPDRLGGECTWTGCVPSKTLLRAARAAHEARNAGALGLETTLRVNFSGVMDRVHEVRTKIYDAADAPPNMARYGVDVIRAAARFVNSRTVSLEGDGPTRLRARWFVIATGSRPKRPALSVPMLDNETVWDLESLPRRLLVLGSGPVGIETAQAFQRLGSEVTVVTSDRRILERDDEECSAVLQRRLIRDGIRFEFGCEVIAAHALEGALAATLSDRRTLHADAIFAAVGREPRTESLDLANAGVKIRDGRIAVDSHCRTTARNIFASGDVTTTARFTHVAESMSYVAVMNAVVGYPARFDESELTWTTFTEPELAHVDKSEEQLRREKRPYTVSRFGFEHLDRAITDDAAEGLVKLMLTPRGRILGATIVGERAGDVIAEVALARKHGISASGLSGTLHGYPTYAMAVRRAADYYVLRGRTRPLLAVLRRLRGLRGIPPSLDSLVP